MSAALAASLILLSSIPVSAGVIIDRGYSSRVDSTVSAASDPFLYEFTVTNTTGGLSEEIFGEGVPFIVDWELPLFSLDDISLGSITSPAGWTHEIIQPFDSDPSVWNYNASMDPLLMSDPGLYGPNPEVFEEPPLVIHWFTQFDREVPGRPIAPGESLSGFGFESLFSQLNAPYLTSWDFLPPIGGDPPIPGQPGFGTPNSPARQAAQNPPVPEPTSLAIFGFGTLMVGLSFNRRKRNA